MKITTNIPTNILTTEYRKKINKAIGRGKKFIATLASQRETIILGKKSLFFSTNQAQNIQTKNQKIERKTPISTINFMLHLLKLLKMLS